MQAVRIIEIPRCKMVSSDVAMFGEGPLERFDQWFSTLPRDVFPHDYLTWDEQGGFRWLYRITESMAVPAEFELIDFPGGLYAIATDIDQQTDHETMQREVDAFLSAAGFERDNTRPALGNIITPPAAHAVLGYCQMDYYTPIKSLKLQP